MTDTARHTSKALVTGISVGAEDDRTRYDVAISYAGEDRQACKISRCGFLLGAIGSSMTGFPGGFIGRRSGGTAGCRIRRAVRLLHHCRFAELRSQSLDPPRVPFGDGGRAFWGRPGRLHTSVAAR